MDSMAVCIDAVGHSLQLHQPKNVQQFSFTARVESIGNSTCDTSSACISCHFTNLVEHIFYEALVLVFFSHNSLIAPRFAGYEVSNNGLFLEENSSRKIARS